MNETLMNLNGALHLLGIAISAVRSGSTFSPCHRPHFETLMHGIKVPSGWHSIWVRGRSKLSPRINRNRKGKLSSRCALTAAFAGCEVQSAEQPEKELKTEIKNYLNYPKQPSTNIAGKPSTGTAGKPWAEMGKELRSVLRRICPGI